MSKTTKIIAALGVVAGLGVAALPAFTYAAGVSGDAQVVVEIDSAIAMSITGNNDSGSQATQDSYIAVPATSIEVGVTDVSGYFVYDNGEYTQATGTAAAQTTYYQLAGAPTYGPANAYSPTGTTSVSGHSVSGYTLNYAANTSSSYVKLLPAAAIQGDHSAQTPAQGNNFGSTITVWTNAPGYVLSVKDKDDITALTHTAGADSIPTGAETVVAGTAKWNFDSTTVTSDYEDKTAQAMPAASASAVTIDSTGVKTDQNGSITKVDYNVATSASQTQGIYTDTIVYTATTAN